MIKRYGYIIAGIVSCAILILTYSLVGNDAIEIVVTATGVVLGFIYFQQQQKILEATLLRQLFDAFNARYDAINDRLIAIQQSDGPLIDTQRAVLEDYFNLCGEEYYYFSIGCIPLEVWSVWRTGIQCYLKDKRIMDIWNEEMLINSYYGLAKLKITGE